MGIIDFFTETLKGPLYIVVVIISIVLIFAIIGFMAERAIKNKKEREKYVDVDNNIINEEVKDIEINKEVNAFEMPDMSSTIEEVKPINDIPSSINELNNIENNEQIDSIPEIIINNKNEDNVNNDIDII